MVQVFPPIVWRQHFPTHVARALITYTTPRGSLSISDLELMGVIAHNDILASARDVRERTM